MLFNLNTSRHLDDLIEESYSRSPILVAIKEALSNGKGWPLELKKALRMPFAEYRVAAKQIYFQNQLVINPTDEELQLQIIYRTYILGPGGYPS